jgi:hypothetical protein
LYALAAVIGMFNNSGNKINSRILDSRYWQFIQWQSTGLKPFGLFYKDNTVVDENSYLMNAISQHTYIIPIQSLPITTML